MIQSNVQINSILHYDKRVTNSKHYLCAATFLRNSLKLE